jgi:hypothetical protein
MRRKATYSKEIAFMENIYRSSFSFFGSYGELHPPFPDEEEAIGGLYLREDRSVLGNFDDSAIVECG